jgi:phosphoribosylanthranilate isomerase
LAEAARAAGAQPVGVFVDADEERLRATAESAGLAVLQLHGSEPPELVARLAGAGRRCWKALRVAASPRRAPQDLFDFSTRYIDAGAEAILLDALVPGSPGGTGRTVPLELAARLAERVPLVLAGGLRPESVAAAVAAVRPWAVDVASGVERAPGDKDLDRVRAFADAARGAGGAHSRP